MKRLFDYMMTCVTSVSIACAAITSNVNVHSTVRTAAPEVIYNEADETEASDIEELLPYTDEEIDLVALVTMAEVEDEPEEVKRLVIDTILNRVDSEHFPDTVYDVIWQPKHFTVMWNGRAERCEVREDIRSLVTEEMKERTDSEVIFFRSSRYSDYGEPMFKEGSVYFSSYD